MTVAPRIAIACSGLGHVQRGVESWASDLAQALRRAGLDITLFAGRRMAGTEAEALPVLRRGGMAATAVSAGLRYLGGWRLGAGSPYEVEQTSFALGLWRRVRHDFDILHVQDPMIAMWLERARRASLSRPKVVYAHGTTEDASVLRRFQHVQLLTQSAADAWMPGKPARQSVFMIPNFVDTARFCPGDQAAARLRFGLPPGRTIILCCAAIRRVHKRIDVLLAEFAAASHGAGSDVMLVIAGSRERDTEGLIAEGTALLGDRVCFLPDLPRHAMPDLYRAADAFVLPSLQEMFGIVLLEALATGLPVLCHDTPDFRTIVGPGGLYADLATSGAIAHGLLDLFQSPIRRGLAEAARVQVERWFCEARVVPDILGMYQSVLASPPDAG